MCYDAFFPYVSDAAEEWEEIDYDDGTPEDEIWAWLQRNEPRTAMFSTGGLESVSRQEALAWTLAFARAFDERYPAYAGRLRFREGCGCGDQPDWWRPQDLERQLAEEETKALTRALREAAEVSA